MISIFYADAASGSETLVTFILLNIAAAIFCIIFFPKLYKAKKFRESETGKEILSFLVKNNGISENEYLANFSSLDLTFRKVVKKLFFLSGLKKDYRYDSQRKIIWRTTYQGLNNDDKDSLHYYGLDTLRIVSKQKNDLENDSIIVTVVTNYLKQNPIGLADLEVACVLFMIRPYDLAVSFHIEENEYAKFLSKIFYSKNLSFDASHRRAYDKIIRESESIQAIKKLYDLLIQQNQIENTNFQFISFCWFCLLKRKELYSNSLKELSEEYQLDFTNKLEDSIIKLYKMGGENVANGVYSFVYVTNSDDSFLSTHFLCAENVKKIIVDYEQKQELSNLQSGKYRAKMISMTDVDLMNGVQFEEFVLSILERKGYKCALTKQSGDQGVDIIATKYSTKIAVQCKCYGEPVGNHAIMEVVAGSKLYKCNKTMVVTNNFFTKSAVELARANDVILWNRDELQKQI